MISPTISPNRRAGKTRALLTLQKEAALLEARGATMDVGATTVTFASGTTRPLNRMEKAAIRSAGVNKVGPRAASTYRAARIPSGKAKVRGVYPKRIDRKTWKTIRARDYSAAPGTQEAAHRLRQMTRRIERQAWCIAYNASRMP